ncbi:MAG: DUF5329 domain-containing protein [Gammaproteobacteria bacterium]|nr:DUF5329 domain-containing protein [Gammaproteobacteria bacterium]
MKHQHRHRALTAWITVALSLLLAATPAGSAPTEQTEQTIRHLIGYVSASDMTFVRNASEYTPQEAAEHMLKKYRHFRDDIETAGDFIELCASKSLLSGKPYRVIDRQGNALPTGDWLRTELAAWQARNL